MVKQGGHKSKLLYLAEIFFRETDEDHDLSIDQLIKRLNNCDISANRKTLYDDIVELQNFGLDIDMVKDGRYRGYRMLSRDFELAELKLLVDAVQGSKFITESKSRELIKKLEELTSIYQAKQLHRQVILPGRVKTMNESIFYSVDLIHSAINQNRQIEFNYYRWNINKELEVRRNGEMYFVSPIALLWDNENYYLIAFEEKADRIKHFRVDKIKNLSVTDKMRVGCDRFDCKALPGYSKGIFGMYGGEIIKVTLECDNELIGTMLDRFGTDVFITPYDNDKFRISVDICLSKQFLGWIFGLEGNAKIVGPEKVRNLMRNYISEIAKLY
ncbi:WYL domain-containing protein [Peptostreptococcus porci]|uniref:helix-turn-helix transcriptional regulator n=1 Tax=Peptostreptococcus porci TaxID=2652282 RepID=UPI002A8123FE|nr:WYL domain-containing protein [Peptostreptococcus porci]MDY4127984.1 WYL domain-containing protein [Peptostreptococcus porci]